MAIHVVDGLVHLLEHGNGRSTSPAGGMIGVNHRIMRAIPQHRDQQQQGIQPLALWGPSTTDASPSNKPDRSGLDRMRSSEPASLQIKK